MIIYSLTPMGVRALGAKTRQYSAPFLVSFFHMYVSGSLSKGFAGTARLVSSFHGRKLSHADLVPKAESENFCSIDEKSTLLR